MTDAHPDSGWWLASDGQWYPPPNPAPTLATPQPAGPQPAGPPPFDLAEFTRHVDSPNPSVPATLWPHEGKPLPAVLDESGSISGPSRRDVASRVAGVVLYHALLVALSTVLSTQSWSVSAFWILAFGGIIGTAVDASRWRGSEFAEMNGKPNQQFLFMVAPLFVFCMVGIPVAVAYWVYYQPYLTALRRRRRTGNVPEQPEPGLVRRFRTGLASVAKWAGPSEAAQRMHRYPSSVFMPVAPEHAVASVVGAMIGHGYIATAVTPTLVTGSLTTEKHPSGCVAILLAVFTCFVGTIIYLFVARSTTVASVAFTIHPVPGGSVVTASNRYASAVLAGIGQPIYS